MKNRQKSIKMQVKGKACELIRQKRKTLALHIDDDCKVIIKAPYLLKRQMIEEFVEKHMAWIEKVQEKKRTARMQDDWFYTKRCLYLGSYYPVIIIINKEGRERVTWTEEGFVLETSGEEERQRLMMECFFKQEAKKLLTKLSNEYAKQIGVKFNRITIRKQKTRWGSCSSKGNLSYNLKMMCAPYDQIAYIALHEVMHLKHFNHSRAFWEAIQQMMPDYKERMNYFKEYGQHFVV